MDYYKLIKMHSREDAFSRLIGMHIVEVGNGTARTEMKINGDHKNPIGSVHGGAIASLADITGGAAAFSRGVRVTTLDSSIHYLRPGINTSCLYGISHELKRGHRVSVYEVTITDQDDVVLATAIYTYMTLGLYDPDEEEKEQKEE